MMTTMKGEGGGTGRRGLPEVGIFHPFIMWLSGSIMPLLQVCGANDHQIIPA